jgi:hypothetical protein
MAFTRFHDDPARIRKQLQESTYLGRYQLNRPGPGAQMPFLEDPNIRLQYWGANLQNNTVDLESEFRNLNRPLNRDLMDKNDYKSVQITSNPPLTGYSTMQPFVEESRATHPAWTYKDKEQSKWELPLLDPQSLSHLEAPFPHQISTRILEKDYFKPVLPKI